MDWQERMHRALTWIENHLAEEIDWNQPAREANCSLYYFFRMFEVITGMTPADYVRRRRLSLAAMELGAGEAKVIDLALKCGYDSPDSFAKAFRKLFGCTPSEGRQQGRRLRAYGPISFSVVLRGDEPMDYRIRRLEAFSLTGIPRRISRKDGRDFQDIPAFWQEVVADGRFQALLKKISSTCRFGLAGVCAAFDDENEEISYHISIETPGDRIGLPEGCVDLMIPAATWGIFESRGPLPSALQETWKRIWHEWLPASGYEVLEGPLLEIFSSTDLEDPFYTSEVWIPLHKAADRP